MSTDCTVVRNSMSVRRILALLIAVATWSLLQTPAAAATLRGHWRLEETSTAQGAVDASGTNPDGTYAAGVDPNVTGAPNLGSGAEFFADGNDINIGAGSVLNFTNDFTVSGWANFDNLSGKHSLIGNGGWAFRSSGTAPQITTFGVQDYTGTGGTLTAGNWVHMAVVLDASNDATFYVNGNPAGTVAGGAPASGNSGAFAIGARGPGDASEAMDGVLDDIGVFEGSLTAAEVKSIFSLASEPDLAYDLSEVNQMLLAFANSDPSVIIDGRAWTLVNDGSLTGPEGEVQPFSGGGIGGFQINLANGNGFTTPGVPEPSSFLLLGLGLYGLARRPRRSAG